MTKLIDIRHPDYIFNMISMLKYRLIKDGGDDFISQYLQKFSTRETEDDFTKRKSLTYCPAFAKSSINEIKNSIYQRIADVRRISDNVIYKNIVNGKNGGVDLKNQTMNNFIGCTILPEMLFMGKVGVYVDMPIIDGDSKLDALNKNPYMYAYTVEDILSWKVDKDSPSDFDSVLLRERHDSFEGNLIKGYETFYRHCYKQDGVVYVDFYDEKSERTAQYVLDIPKIPFTLFSLSESLLTDVANYQISLLNLSSADINYCIQANFPFYTEQTDFARQNFAKLPGETGENSDNVAKDNNLNLGVVQGKQYGKNLERPAFINPSAEPLDASMRKQEQLRHEIRELVHLSLSNVMSKSASAESKSVDNQGLESGLSYIAIELEAGERKVAEFIQNYLKTDDPIVVHYPKRFNLLSEDERLRDIEAIQKRMPAIPSKTYQRAMAKELVIKLLGHKISDSDLEKIFEEIDSAEAIVSDPDIIIKDVEAGFLSGELASKLRMYPDGDYTKAMNEHVEKLARVAEAQMPRGVDKGPTATQQAKLDKQQGQSRGDGRFQNNG